MTKLIQKSFKHVTTSHYATHSSIVKAHIFAMGYTPFFCDISPEIRLEYK